MTDLDLDALEATASAPNMDRDNSYVTSATTTLALIARIREAEAKEREAWGVANTRLDAYTEVTREMHARELHHLETEKLLADAEAAIEAALFATDNLDMPMAEPVAEARRILTRHQDKRENGNE